MLPALSSRIAENSATFRRIQATAEVSRRLSGEPSEFRGEVERVRISQPEGDLLDRFFRSKEQAPGSFHLPVELVVNRRNPESAPEETVQGCRAQMEVAGQLVNRRHFSEMTVEIAQNRGQRFRRILPL